jgi:NAD(P)-dependent dehydrogenase (short-subunit alcohol dehydrogenase family)
MSIPEATAEVTRDWRGRTAVVTGASRGIGRAVALELARRGATLALIARDGERLQELAETCASLAVEDAGAPTWFACDVTEAAQVAGAVGEIAERFNGRLDLLANVAGAPLRAASLEEQQDEDWHRSLELHLVAPARLQRLLFPALAEAGGCVVNVGSIVAERAPLAGGPYAAAKAGLAALTRAAAVEWGRHGVRACLVEPGYVDTDFNRDLVASGADERLLRRVPLRRVIRPEEVARVVVFAGQPEGPMTGASLRVDGGLAARL